MKRENTRCSSSVTLQHASFPLLQCDKVCTRSHRSTRSALKNPRRYSPITIIATSTSHNSTGSLGVGGTRTNSISTTSVVTAMMCATEFSIDHPPVTHSRSCRNGTALELLTPSDEVMRRNGNSDTMASGAPAYAVDLESNRIGLPSRKADCPLALRRRRKQAPTRSRRCCESGAQSPAGVLRVPARERRLRPPG